jgi:hypothetical protein
MSKPTPRPTRSRISSPFVSGQANGTPEPGKYAADNGERPKTFMDRWVEPPIPAPRPSFAEAGIERHGVVANMAPLGTRPSAKVMKSALRPEVTDGGVRGTNAKRTGASASSTPVESVVTPEPPANPPRRRSVSTKTDDFESAPKTPTQQTSPRKSVPRQTPASQNSGQGVFAIQQSPAPITTNMPRQSPQVPTPVAPPTPHYPIIGIDGEYEINLEQTDRVVEAAVQEALDHRRWPTAYALRTLYDDHRTDVRMVRLIEAIYGGYATDAQNKEFRSVMRQKKKEGKKDRTGEYYFNGDGSDPPPITSSIFSAVNAVNPVSAVTPLPAFSLPIFTNPVYQPSNTVYQTPYTPLNQTASGTTSLSNTQARSSSVNQSSVSVSAPSPKETDHAHVSKKHKRNSFQATDIEVNGDASANGDEKAKEQTASDQPQENGSSKAEKSRSRSDSNSSSSSLSSLDENLLGSEFNSPVKHPAPAPSGSTLTGFGSGTGALFASTFGAAANGQQGRFVSPYANPDNFAAVLAENQAGARNQSKPITTQAKVGPKTYTFPTVTTNNHAHTPAGRNTTSPAVAPSSSATNNHANTNANHVPPPSSTQPEMAPALLLASSNSSSTSHSDKLPKQGLFKIKNSSKVQPAAPYDENDSACLRKRKAKQTTNYKVDANESFERHQVKPTAAQEIESASDGGETVAAAPPSKRPAKVRLLNRESKQRYNYDSEDLSSPTLLSFPADIAPGSVSTSRAGTPNALNRPTRKAKTGTGLRVKTS